MTAAIPARAREGATRPAPDPQIRFCRGADGVRLAWASHGSGPPLVVVSCWLSHLQHDWQSPVWRHFLDDLGVVSTLIRYDERGFGMSDWNVTDFSLDARLRDLEAIVDAVGVDRFALLGMSGGGPVAMAYAAAHPDRVSRMILYGTVPAHPWPTTEEGWAEDAAYRGLIRVGWARGDARFRRVFTSMFIPGASDEQMRWFDDLQRMSTSAENALASRTGRQAIDVTERLAQIRVPTLVLHAVGDEAVEFDEGRDVAARIPNARLVPLDSRNHVLLADEPAWRVFLAETNAFLEPDRRSATHGPPLEELSPRELDVLRSASTGRTNDEIATDLGLSVRTVERHLSNAYGKLGLEGTTARTTAVAELVRRQLT